MRTAIKASSMVVFRDVDGSEDTVPPALPADYARERMRKEQEAASKAVSDAAEQIHQQLALAYAAIAVSGEGEAATGGTGS